MARWNPSVHKPHRAEAEDGSRESMGSGLGMSKLVRRGHGRLQCGAGIQIWTLIVFAQNNGVIDKRT